MDQGTMFEQFEGRGLARRTDPSTSHEAARKVKVGALQLIVLRELRDSDGGLTIKELKISSSTPMESISPRFAPLRMKGLIMDTGERRQNPGGRKGIVWDITGFGLAVLMQLEMNTHFNMVTDA